MQDAYKAVVESIKFANRKCRSLLRPEFGEYSAMYTFTTENLAAYLDKLVINGKSILTVTASGDQLINLALLGASSVDNFDSCRNAYYMSKLKIAALKSLTYEEFLLYFSYCEEQSIDHLGIISIQQPVNENPHFLSYNLYLKIRSYLEDDVSYYFDYLYNEYNFSSEKLKCSKLFFLGSKKEAITNNNYLANANNYYEARNRIEQVSYSFYNCDVYQICNIQSQYDIILLSNIYDYVTFDEYNQRNDNTEYIQYIKNNLDSILNPEGQVAVTYQYRYREKNMANRTVLQRLFGKGKYIIENKPELDQYRFKKIIVSNSIDIYRETDDDCIYVYEKGKCK